MLSYVYVYVTFIILLKNDFYAENEKFSGLDFEEIFFIEGRKFVKKYKMI